MPPAPPTSRLDITTSTAGVAGAPGPTTAVDAGESRRSAGRHRRRVVPTAWIGAALALTCSFDFAVAQTPSATCEREVATAAQRYGIPLAVFYAVGLNESGARGRLQPFAMNIDGRAAIHASVAEAVAGFRKAKAEGARMVDVGCMQINHHYHAAKFPSLEAMFDPRLNVDYAARFLRELKDREKTWTMAVARYNAGPNNDPAQKRYVCGVLERMVASGFGAWTVEAKKFCSPAPVAKSPSDRNSPAGVSKTLPQAT